MDKHGLLGIWRRSSISYRKDEKEKLADELVTSGLLQEVIARVVGWPDRRWVYDYYRRRNLLDLYRKSKPGHLSYVSFLIETVGNEIKQELSTIVEMAQIQAYSKANDVERRIFKHFKLTPGSEYKWGTLEEVLRRHYTALERGQKKTTGELCYGLDISPTGLVRLRKELHLKPLYGSLRPVTREEQEVIRRAFRLNMSISDIAHFIPPLKPGTVALHMSKIGRRPKVKTPYLGIVHSHKLASQIYSIQDQDVGFSMEEIAEYLNTSIEKVKYALEHRDVIKPMIIDALRWMYMDKRINKPYLHHT